MYFYGCIVRKVSYRLKFKVAISEFTYELLDSYQCSLLFISLEYHLSQLVKSRDRLQWYDLSSTIEFSDEFFIQKAAKILRKTVLLKIINASDLPWPSIVKSLQSKSRDHPEILKQLYMNLLCDDYNHHKISERVKNSVDSFSVGIMHAASKGKFLTFMHIARALGLHSATRQKLPITLLHRVCHCISCDQINLIEIGQAELAPHYQNMVVSFPLQPATNDCFNLYQ